MLSFLALGALVLAAGGTPSVPPVRNTPAEPICSALAGAWVGALEYRDYSSNARVLLPTILGIREAKGGQALILHYIYDDGPTKVVQDNETVVIDPVAATYTTVSGDGKQTDKEGVVGIAAFLKTGRGKLVRSGAGKENGKAVDVRTTLTVSADSLIILKETRPPGGKFQFRDQYKKTRVGPVTVGK